MILYFVDKIFRSPHICLCFSESSKSTFGNTLRHRSLTYNKDVLSYDLVPYSLLLFYSFYSEKRSLCPCPVNAVCHIKRIQSRFGVDLQNTGFRGENFCGNLSFVYKPWFRNHILILCVIKVIASKTVSEVHVYHAPRSKHRFLIRITESTEDVRNPFDSFLYTQFVRGTGHRADSFSGCTEYFRVIVFFEAVEFLLGHSLGHELFP